jgi:hypothetical protein
MVVVLIACAENASTAKPARCEAGQVMKMTALRMATIVASLCRSGLTKTDQNL